MTYRLKICHIYYKRLAKTPNFYILCQLYKNQPNRPNLLEKSDDITIMQRSSLILLCLAFTLGSNVKAKDKFITEIQESLDAEILVSLNETLAKHQAFSLVESPDMELLEKIIQDESLKADAGYDPLELE